MKLSNHDIAAIEKFLTERESETAVEQAEKLGVSLSAFYNGVGLLKRIGVSFPDKRGLSVNVVSTAELQEFRAWKSRQQQAAE